MKLFSKLLAVVFIFSTASAFAQGNKFGHINIQELINLMPERDSAVVKLEKYSQELQETLTAFQTEYQTKVTTYQQKQATWTAATLEAKQKEIVDLEARINSYQQNAQAEYQQMYQLLFAPVYKKANETLEKIGKAQSFTYIFDTSGGTIPFIGAESVNVLPLAKTELKIPADKKVMVPKSAQQEQPAQAPAKPAAK
jgi:outer membrane protein